MKKIYHLLLGAFAAILILSSCEEESDMAFDRVASPVLLVTTPVENDAIQGTFYELDKSGILDQNVGIDSVALSDLNIQVFSGETSLGSFTTDASGSIVVPNSGDLEWVGEYKGVSFRFIQ